MRTKTLLLTAALSAAGIATSMAQVYSVNAVGYVNTQLVPGFNLISNPLRSTEPNGNQVQNLFRGLPGNTVVYLWNGAGFDITTFDADFEEWNPANVAQREVLPGQGAFVQIPATAGNRTVTFVGEVEQGTLTVPIAVGFNLVSSRVPQEGIATGLGYVPRANDSLYFWNEATQNYTVRTYDADFGEFDGPLPTLTVGDAFFLRAQTAGTWTRTFDVND